jgi:phosphoribosyl 1,2-cyclic phosphate phosphodiesterase
VERQDKILKLTYYGTAAGEGWPGLFCNCDLCNTARKLKGKNIRTRSQALINDDLLIDLTPDTNMHSLVYGLDLGIIDNLLVTHSHSDHFNAYEIEMLREPFAHERPNTFHIYGNNRVKEKIWSEVPGIEEVESKFNFHYAEPFQPIKIKDYIVVPLLALHDKKEECLFYQITQGNKTILYAHDTGAFPDATISYLKENKVHLDLVSLDCTTQSEADGKNHMGLIDAVKERQRLTDLGLGDENTVWVVNHFSHNGLWLHDQMVEEAAKYDFKVSFDGMVIEI